MKRDAKKVNRSSRTCCFEGLESRQLMSGGQLQTAFGGGSINAANGLTVHDVASTATGQVISVGYQAGNSKSFVVQRYNKNGTLDTTFGNNGTAVTPLAIGYAEAEQVAVQKDGKIVVAGIRTDGGNNTQWVLTRYTTTGALDTTFGNHNGINPVLGYQETSQINDMALQADGKIVFVVEHSDNGFFSDSSDFQTVRLLTSGALDPNFGDGSGSNRKGYVITDMGGDIDVPHAIAFQSDGKILVGGGTTSTGYWSFALARYTTDGRPDNSFDDNGKLATNFASGSSISSLAVDGTTIYAAGELTSTTPGNKFDMFAIAKYNSAGVFDAHFGNGGVLTKPIANEYAATAGQLIISQPGKILLNGWVRTKVGPDSSIISMQFNSDGSKDTSFGVGGKSLFSVKGIPGLSPAAVTPDGDIVTGIGNQIIEYVEAKATVSLSFGNDGAEGGQAGSTWFRRDAAYNFATTIYFQEIGTATGGSDFTGALNVLAVASNQARTTSNVVGQVHAIGKIVIPAGQSAVRVFASIVDDNVAEPIELITSSIVADGRYTIGNGVSNISILDNDSVAPHKLTASIFSNVKILA